MMKPLELKFIQRNLFEQVIRNGSIGAKEIVSEVSELLDIRQGAVYKRLSGETFLKFDEIVKICKKFNVSIDNLIHDSERFITFNFDLLDKQFVSGKDFLNYYKAVLDDIRKRKDNEVIYLSTELPFFHYLNYPLLFQFKMFFWQYTSFATHPNLENSDLNLIKMSDEDLRDINYLITEYYNHPVSEIWNSCILDNLYSQIKYFTLARVIKDLVQIENLCSNIQLLINHLKILTAQGVKTKPGSNSKTKGDIRVYINEIEIGSNMVYYRADQMEAAYIIHNFPSFIHTKNPSFCSYTKNLLSNIKSLSTQISVEGKRERTIFFEKIQSKFERFRKEITNVYNYSSSV